MGNRLANNQVSILVAFSLLFSVAYSVAISPSPAIATDIETVVIDVDLTDASKVTGTSLTNDAIGKSSDLTIGGTPTMSATTDGFDFVYANGSHLIGNIGSTSSTNKVVVEMTLKLKDAGNINNSNGSMIFGFGTNSSSYVNYNIYHHSGFIGFNTFNSELYGVAVPDTSNFYDYKFVMVKNSESYTAQEIWINGVKQTLAYQTSGLLSRTSETNSARVFSDGDYNNGDVTIMRHSLGSTWNASGYMRSVKVTTFNTPSANQPAITSISPTSGPAKGGSLITITGTDLSGASVTFDGNAGTVTANTATSITVINPSGTAGTVDVEVTTTGGTDTETGAFTYVSGLLNGNFETDAVGSTSLTNWTVVGTGASRINVGVASLGGCTSIDTTNYQSTNLRGALEPENDNYTDGSYSGSITTVSSISSGPTVSGKAVALSNSTTAPGYHVIHGPAIVSDTFGANAGDVVTLDWFAKAAGDDFAILGYLLDTSNCTQTEVIDASGTSVTGWQSASVTIPATKGTYKFVFIHGTFDKSGGTVGGATMYIDNITSGQSQTVTINSPAAGSTQNTNFSVSGTASSGLSVSYGSNTTSVCTVNSSTGEVTRVIAGTCTITASQTGNDVYAAAAQVSRSFTVVTGPTNSSAPTVSGTKTNGQTLTGAKGTWNEGGRPTTYSYQWQSSPDSGSTWADISGADSTSYVLTDNEVGKIVRLKVIATNDVASSNPAYSTATTAIAAIAPSAPTGLSATAGNSQVTLSWTGGSDGGSAITDYVVEYSTDNSNWSTFSDGTSTSTSATVTGLTNGTLYYFRVKATNNIGTGSASSNATATPAEPAAPSGGGSTTPSATPTPTPTPTPTQTPRTRRTIAPTPTPTPSAILPSITPTPIPTQTPQAGSPTRPVELVKKAIEEIVEVLRPRIVDLNTLIDSTRSPDPVASANASSAVSALPTSQALALVQVPENEKRVAEIPSSVLNDGVPEESRIIVIEETKSQVVTGDGGLLTVESKAGNEPVPVDSRGRVQMVRENSVETEGQGMAPESEFAVYLFSDPLLLGVGKTDLAGRFFASFPVEDELPLGDHTLQVVGITSSGEQRTVSMPVVVVADVKTAKTEALPETILVDQNPVQAWFESVNYLLSLLLVLIMVSLWVLFGMRRRRREEE